MATEQTVHQGAYENHDGSRRNILKDFKATHKSRNWELRDIAGHIVEFSSDQDGCRLVVKILISASSDDQQRVFDEIIPNVLQLIQDEAGSYVSGLYLFGPKLKKTRLAGEMNGHILTLSKQKFGCTVVQKAIEHILPDQKAAIVRELEPNIIECIYHSNGNYVIQTIIKVVPPAKLGFVYSFREIVYSMATHMFGSRVLQLALDSLPNVMIAPLAAELHSMAVILMKDEFGKYLMQYLIKKGRPYDRTLLLNTLRGQLLQMAQDKYASDVCETALEFSDAETRRQLINVIISSRPNGVVVRQMIKHRFANYVLHSALKFADVNQRDILIFQIRHHLVSIELDTSNPWQRAACDRRKQTASLFQL
ncbi:armadillo-type protein [Rhodocollybia butyracea]|uniref:Armadillo-type protein n=1 Tax=Rhodocollybia butyracea TaxID=206335 RepID=A0A9P5PC34_9AGAR|nr:armadillo-type protein [Rhodocollybia butyracea]